MKTGSQYPGNVERMQSSCKHTEKRKKKKKYWTRELVSCILDDGHFGEVPKLAEGAPLERE